MSDRFLWVDQSKGIGIVLVVIGHVAAGLYNSGIDVSGTGYDLIMNFLYSFHMPLFFFLSGLFLISSVSKRGTLSFISTKVDSVVYPYVVWSILQGGIQVLLSNFTNSDISLVSVFQLWDPKGQFWFLYILFFSFVLSSLLIRFISDRFLEVVLIAAFLLYLNSKNINFIFMGELFFQNYVFFIGGAVFYKHKDKLLSWLSSKTAALIFGLLFVGSQLYYNSIFQGNFLEKEPVLWMVGVISVFAVISFCTCIGFQNSLFSRTLEVLGKYSMGIYVMHVIAGAAARVLLKKLGVEDFYTHLILGSIVGVVGPLVACKILEVINFKYMFSAPVTDYVKSIIKRDDEVRRG